MRLFQGSGRSLREQDAIHETIDGPEIFQSLIFGEVPAGDYSFDGDVVFVPQFQSPHLRGGPCGLAIGVELFADLATGPCRTCHDLWEVCYACIVSVPSSSGRPLRVSKLINDAIDTSKFQSPHLRGGPCGPKTFGLYLLQIGGFSPLIFGEVPAGYLLQIGARS